MQTVKQGLLLSFLDWNRDKGRELNDLRTIGKANYQTYERLVKAYAIDTGVSFESDCAGIRSNRSFLALCTDEIDTRQTREDFDIVSSHSSDFVSPRELAERYEAIPNRVYLFMTGLDKTLGSIVRGQVREIGQLSSNHFDIAVPMPDAEVINPYTYFQSMFWFQKLKAQRQNIPFFLLYSRSGHVIIQNENGKFDPYYLRQLLRVFADEFENIKGAARQSQLNKIKKNSQKVRPRSDGYENKSTKRKIRWGWLAAGVTVLASVSTILSNYDQARETICSALEYTKVAKCGVEQSAS